MTPITPLDVADDLRARLAGFAKNSDSGALCAERAKSVLPTDSANCAHSLQHPNSLASPMRPAMSFATREADVKAGFPLYRVGDEPLKSSGSVRNAGLNALILAFSTRRHVDEWLTLAGSDPLEAAVLRDVQTDLRQALAVLESRSITEPAAPMERHRRVESQTDLSW